MRKNRGKPSVALRIAILTVATLITGCGIVDAIDPKSASGDFSSRTQTPPCNSTSPYSVAPSRQWSSYISICQYQYPGSIVEEVVNNSPTVLIASSTGGLGSLKSYPAPLPAQPSLADTAMAEWVATSTPATIGEVVLIPGSRVTGPANQTFLRIDSDLSIRRYSVITLGNYVQSKLTPPSIALNESIVKCGSDVGILWRTGAQSNPQQPPTTEAVFAQSLQTGVDCRRTWKSIQSALREKAPRTDVVSELKAVAKTTGSTLVDDVIRFAKFAVNARH